MGETTAISWTDHTFNPWIGCTKVSAGCANCYAETLDKRWGHDSWGPGKPRRMTSLANWRKPAQWDEAAREAGVRRRVFCASLADVFDAEAPVGGLDMLWALIRRTPNLDWQLLTKRTDRIAASLPDGWGEGWPNVWLGTSVENQEWADKRIPILMAVPAKVRFLSCEPLVGPVTLPDDVSYVENQGYCGGCEHCGNIEERTVANLHWVIVGGESGPGARPMNLEWARNLKEQCADRGIAFFFKQSGGARPGTGEELDGRPHQEFPWVAP